MPERPAINSTFRRRHDGQIITVVGYGGAWVIYRAGVDGEGRKNSIMEVNFHTKYEPWPTASPPTGPSPSDQRVGLR